MRSPGETGDRRPADGELRKDDAEERLDSDEGERVRAGDAADFGETMDSNSKGSRGLAFGSVSGTVSGVSSGQRSALFAIQSTQASIVPQLREQR